jgi:hypothetical protein
MIFGFFAILFNPAFKSQPDRKPDRKDAGKSGGFRFNPDRALNI